MKLLPKTLTGRMLLVLLVGLTVSHLIGLAIYSGDRYLALTTQSGRNVAGYVAAAVKAFEETAPRDRRALARSLWTPGFSVVWAPESAITAEDRGWRAKLVRAAIGAATGDTPAERIRILQRQAGSRGAPPFAAGAPGNAWIAGDPHMRHMRAMGMPGAMVGPMEHMMRAWRSGPVLEVSLQLADTSWLNFAVLTAPTEPFWSLRLLVSIAVVMAAVTLLSIWAVGRATRPLALFAQAAERLGTDIDAPPVAETGSSEVGRLARAFNDMQRRLRRFVRDRTQMLAAISHDLRTPITRLRLRADFLDDREQQRKMLADLDEMEAMIAATLSFAREEVTQEPQKRFDLAVLLRDLCEDAADRGQTVDYHGEASLAYRGRPLALKRVFTNLVDNAVDYGGGAEVTLATTSAQITVTVEDRGPGIPEGEMENVFAPFYRLDASRGKDTGGVGLGLAAVRSIVRSHGGEVTLQNRKRGGLRVTVTLPLS